MKTSRRPILSCLLLAFVAVVPASAQVNPFTDRVWLGTQSTDWQTAANWNVGLPVTTASTSIAPNASVVLSSGNADIGYLYIGDNNAAPSGSPGGSTLNVTNGATLSATFISFRGSQNTLRIDGTGTQVVARHNGVTSYSDNSIVVSGGAYLDTFDGGLEFSAGSLTISGSGSLVRASAGAHTLGQTLLTNGGTLDVRASPTVPGSGYLTVFGPALSIGAEAGSAAVAPGTLLATRIQDSSGSIVFNHTSGAYTFAAALEDPHANGFTLTHLAGHTTLTGANNLTAPVTLSGGTLRVNNTLGTGDVLVNGGTLSGTGQIDGLTTINAGATLAPGNSPGTLTFTNGLTLNDGAALDFELGTTSDLLRITGGTLTGSASAGGITLNLANSGGFAADTYVLLDFAGATTSDFDLSDFTLDTTISGYDYALAFNGSALELTATVSAVPEPATYAVALAAVALAMTAIRRRKAQSSANRNSA